MNFTSGLASSACPEVLMEDFMKRINGYVYSDKEWKDNQVGILMASVVFIWGFILMWYFFG